MPVEKAVDVVKSLSGAIGLELRADLRQWTLLPPAESPETHDSPHDDEQ
jgi:hypothetical protein